MLPCNWATGDTDRTSCAALRQSSERRRPINVTGMLTRFLRAPQTHDAATHQTRCDQHEGRVYATNNGGWGDDTIHADRPSPAGPGSRRPRVALGAGRRAGGADAGSGDGRYRRDANPERRADPDRRLCGCCPGPTPRWASTRSAPWRSPSRTSAARCSAIRSSSTPRMTLCNAEGGQTAATKLAANPQTVVVLGPACSSAATPAAPILWQAGHHRNLHRVHRAGADRAGPQARVRRLRPHRLQRQRAGQGGRQLRRQGAEG